MTLNKAKGRMFKSVGWTWNPIWGCTHNCSYCWARSWAERWGKSFEPQFREDYLKDQMPDDGTWVFVGSMGDVFCKDVPAQWIIKLLNFIEQNKSNNLFLLQTKNPRRLFDFLEILERIKDKIILGTTLETTWDTPWSDAPPTDSRAEWLILFKRKGFKTFLSLEPLSRFNQIIMRRWINFIQPEAIEIGLENYTNFTDPPSKWRIKELLTFIQEKNFLYILKGNLSDLFQSSP